ncbi:MAG: response regulator [Patescibacteria group bacterium]
MRKHTVFIAETNKEVRRLLIAMLSLSSVAFENVISISNHNKAIEMIREISNASQSIDMLIVNLGWNKKGLAVVHEARKLFPKIKIFMTSGAADHKDVKAAKLAGADCFLKKPFNIKNFLETIKEVKNS